MKLDESEEGILPSDKAGFIPFVVENGEVVMMFMKSSDARFGGDKPMIAKGYVDAGESVYAAAIREAEEELGLKANNLIEDSIMLGWNGSISGICDSYPMTIYMGQVKSRTQAEFIKPHYETESVHWMTFEEYVKNGRLSQLHIVKECHDKMIRYHALI